MTTPQGARVPRRSLDAGQIGAAVLTGVLHGLLLAGLVAAFGWYVLGGFTAIEQEVGGWILLGLCVVALAVAWFGGVALLRRRSYRRARLAVSCSLALSAVVTAIVTLVTGWLAVMLGFFATLLIWSGDYFDDIAVTAVVLICLMALLLSTANAVVFTAALAAPDAMEG
jgi:hypothetical protein